MLTRHRWSGPSSQDEWLEAARKHRLWKSGDMWVVGYTKDGGYPSERHFNTRAEARAWRKERMFESLERVDALHEAIDAAVSKLAIETAIDEARRSANDPASTLNRIAALEHKTNKLDLMDDLLERRIEGIETNRDTSGGRPSFWRRLCDGTRRFFIGM